MASFEIEGLTQWKRSAVLWGLIGLLGAISSKPPLGLVGLSLVFGFVAAVISLALAYRNKGQFSIITHLAALATIIGLAWTHDGGLSGLASLSLGALFLSAEAIASGLLGQRLIKHLNRKHAATLSIPGSSARKVAHRPLRPATPESTPRDVLDKLLAALPEPLATEARAFSKPAIVARPYRSLESLPPESSCLSGAPLLDPAKPWPQFQGKPLEFLAQIHLPELPNPGHTAPSTGLLSFFYDTDSQSWGHDESDLGTCAILHHPDTKTLAPVLKPGTGPHPPLRKPLRFHRVDDFNPNESFEDRFRDLIETLDEEAGEYLDDLHETLLENGPPETHRVLSLPLLIQGDMDGDLATASRAYNLPEETEWTLLLQLDSDADLGWCWGDAGFLYFWIPVEDLAKGRFHRPWVVLQCT